jgi:hypothetical protein
VAFEVQAALRRPILLENPSSYLKLTDSTIPEVEFPRAFVLAHPPRSTPLWRRIRGFHRRLRAGAR